jgi:hypothetical protein
MCGILWPWLQASEPIAVWLEAIALIAIFFLDWKERKENRRERQEQHEENAAQLLVAQCQAEANKKSADAAIEASLAAKKSAEIAADLHRPFIGLATVAIPGGTGARVWHFVFTIENYGTLPAQNVGVVVDFFIDNAPRGKKTESESVQIFPSAEFHSNVELDLGNVELVPVQNGTLKLSMDVLIRYQSADTRRFEYLAKVSYTRGRLQIDKSETRSLGATAI